MHKYHIRDLIFSYSMIAPAFLIVIAFAFIPSFYALYLSLFRSNFLIFNRRFVGLSNYITILNDGNFWSAFLKTFNYTAFGVVLQFAIGLFLALALNKKLKGISFYRTAIVLPWTLSPVLVAIIFSILYSPTASGFLNYIMMSLGLIKEPAAWLGIGNAMKMVIIANTWFGMPFSLIMELAGLQSIPQEVYEAAKVDGASPVQTFFRITMPLLRPTMLVNLIWITISTFNEFDLVYALTGGGPINETNLLGIYMYNTAFKAGKFELGATIAVIMFVINAVLAVIYTRALRTQDISY